MDGLVQSHLYGADNLDVGLKGLEHLVRRAGTRQVGEDQRVHIQAAQTVEGVQIVAELLVEGRADLHLAIDGQVGHLLVYLGHGLSHFLAASRLVGTEIGVADKGNLRVHIEEMNGSGGQLGDIHQFVGVGVVVDQGVGHEEGAALRVQDMHRAESLEFRAHADDLLHHLQRVGVFRVKAGDEGIGIAGLHHHHAKVVALKHLVVGFLEGVAVTLALLGEDTGIALTALGLAVVAQVHDLYALQAQLELGGQLLYALVVA